MKIRSINNNVYYTFATGDFLKAAPRIARRDYKRNTIIAERKVSQEKRYMTGLFNLLSTLQISVIYIPMFPK